MRLLRFFYCLCALLLAGAVPSVAAAPAADMARRFSIETPLVRIQAPAEPGHRLLPAMEPAPSFQQLISDEPEDEDTNELRAEGFDSSTLLLYRRACPTYTAILRHPANCFRTASVSPVTNRTKYLLLGVLRI